MKSFFEWIAHDVVFLVIWTAFVFTVMISPAGEWIKGFLPWNKGKK